MSQVFEERMLKEAQGSLSSSHRIDSKDFEERLLKESGSFKRLEPKRSF